jgi:serine/threonine protein kinase
MATKGSIPVYLFDMELGDQTLANFIQDRFNTGPWARPDLGEVWTIMLDLAGGLIFLHRRKMIHRDLKPANGYTFLEIC